MEGKFWRQKNKKNDFYKNKTVVKIDDIDVNKILASKEDLYGTKNSFKHFVGCSNNDVIRELFIKFPQMIGYVRKFQGNTTTSFKISNKTLLKKYNQIWKRVKKLLKIEFDSEPVYDDNDKYIKIKMKINTGSVNTNFQGKKMPKEKAPCKSLSIIILDSVIKTKKNYRPQTLLEEFKYEQKKIKMENLIDDDSQKILSDKEADNDSNDEMESNNEKDNDESNE